MFVAFQHVVTIFLMCLYDAMPGGFWMCHSLCHASSMPRGGTAWWSNLSWGRCWPSMDSHKSNVDWIMHGESRHSTGARGDHCPSDSSKLNFHSRTLWSKILKVKWKFLSSYPPVDLGVSWPVLISWPCCTDEAFQSAQRGRPIAFCCFVKVSIAGDRVMQLHQVRYVFFTFVCSFVGSSYLASCNCFCTDWRHCKLQQMKERQVLGSCSREHKFADHVCIGLIFCIGELWSMNFVPSKRIAEGMRILFSIFAIVYVWRSPRRCASTTAAKGRWHPSRNA